ncbi:Phosphatidylinositol 3,4,5-trisphosphate 5-phosphatase 2B [Phytophthora ramorum]|uniref:Phosphatidylinositol 3,4,5-trisphosphate 5-phosphatase 2B n=1 Tax=Phytophthora ramorum TaxID=164328 RepID=UPI0030AE9525|nr:Phosphatidylinositol 3,4,5-trisphosphate 5-phosphatase 2B [Phytophthora ramorum]
MEGKQEVDSVPDPGLGAASRSKSMPLVQVEDIQLEVDHDPPTRRQTVRTAPFSSPIGGRKASVNITSMGTPLKILVASWNVGNTMPPKDSKLLDDWIPEGGGDFDVIAVGLQESTYKSEKVSENLVRTDSWHTSSSKADDQDDEHDATDAPTLESVIDGNEFDDVDEEEEYEEDENESKDYDSGDKTSIKRPGSVSNTEENNSPSSEAIRAGRAGSSTSEPSSSAIGTNKSSDVIVKRSRTKKSMRKMTRMVRQLSSNLMGDALDYPFSKQIYLHLGESYVLAGKVELMEMRLYVYVHERNNVCEVDKLAVPTGLGSVLGNKGGLLFKCVVENTSLCFASCHLAAHQDQKFLDKRNSDCATILGTQFGQKNVSIDHQFDHCFWFGDLNYRLDLNYTAPHQRNHEKHCAEVMALVRAKKWVTLNQNDQLKHQVEGKKTLTGWELPPALFPPTFKRVRHSLDEYLLERVPSYCDRVLYKSLPGLRTNIKLQRFSCFEAIATSDHKPVAAAFHVARAPSISSGTAEKPTLVEMVDLAGKDLLGLDLAGLSDPYVKFYSAPSNAVQVDANGSHPSTTTISNTCSPKWRDDQVPKLHVLCDQERDVKRVHLTLVVMDYDATSKDDLMGVASLSLDKFCQGRPRFMPFEVPVVLHGKAAGTITGKIRVTLPHQATPPAEESGQQMIRVAGCHCTLS